MSLFTSTKKLASVASASLALALLPASVALAGWGPDRPTFTWDNTATYITFNSITNNPSVGDERAFFSGKDANSSGNVQENLHVTDNEEIIMRVYFHNNAASNLNLVATNTRVKIFLPTKAESKTFATSYIVADNANPMAVADTFDMNGDRPFTLEYEKGSAQLWNNVFRGATLSDDIVTNNGALVGYDKIDGRVPGCAQYSGYVTIKARVHMQPAPTPTPTPTPTPKPTPKPAPAPAKSLPNTGAGDVLGIFAGASAAGSAAHMAVRARRNRR